MISETEKIYKEYYEDNPDMDYPPKKRCLVCGIEKWFIKFYKDEQNKDGLCSQCKNCIGKNQKEHGKTLISYLRRRFSNIKSRCNSYNNPSFKYYGGRNIEVKFTSDEFVDYVINIFGFAAIEKIKGLHIHRIDINGHYELGNIEFLTSEEHSLKHLAEKRNNETNNN